MVNGLGTYMEDWKKAQEQHAQSAWAWQIQMQTLVNEIDKLAQGNLHKSKSDRQYRYAGEVAKFRP